MSFWRAADVHDRHQADHESPSRWNEAGDEQRETAEVLVTCAITIMKIAWRHQHAHRGCRLAINDALSAPVVAGLGERAGIKAEPSAETFGPFSIRRCRKRNYATTIHGSCLSPALTPARSALRAELDQRVGSCQQRSIRLPAHTKAGISRASTQLCGSRHQRGGELLASG